MPQKTLTVAVAPAVMRWARESAGVSEDAVAKRVGTGVEVVKQWESGARPPTLRALEDLAVYYKRPLAAFFLPAPPDEPPPPQDFRHLPEAERKPSKETLLAIREARRLQRVASELMGEMGLPTEARIEPTSLAEDPERAAQRERERLGISVEKQIAWRDDSSAFREWRRAVESLNVLVFRFHMPMRDKARGFSLVEGRPPAIAVSTLDAPPAQIFTLFHEYAHVLLGTAGICCPDEAWDSDVKEQAVERFCNRFAGALLVPVEELRRRAPAGTDAAEALGALVQAFKVSRWVIWFRMRAAGMLSRETFQSTLDEWRREEPKPPPRRGGRGLKQAARSLRKRGAKFAELILEAKARNLITYSDMADYLAVRVKNFEEVYSLLRGPQ